MSFETYSNIMARVQITVIYLLMDNLEELEKISKIVTEFSSCHEDSRAIFLFQLILFLQMFHQIVFKILCML